MIGHLCICEAARFHHYCQKYDYMLRWCLCKTCNVIHLLSCYKYCQWVKPRPYALCQPDLQLGGAAKDKLEQEGNMTTQNDYSELFNFHRQAESLAAKRDRVGMVNCVLSYTLKSSVLSTYITRYMCETCHIIKVSANSAQHLSNHACCCQARPRSAPI